MPKPSVQGSVHSVSCRGRAGTPARDLLRNALRHSPATVPPPILASRLDERRWTLEVTELLDRASRPIMAEAVRPGPAGRRVGGQGAMAPSRPRNGQEPGSWVLSVCVCKSSRLERT
jgi:hypothetical protein